MGIFSQLELMGHEQIVFCNDVSSGLKAIIAIHNTNLGPALGGTRLLPYLSEEEALNDVLRLSRGMTYKAACAGLNLGGGKAVIIADPKKKTENMFRAYGRFINSLGGHYITAEDMNTSMRDMDFVRLETRYVTGSSPALGGSGDPSLMTALGTYYGIETAVKHRLQKENLKGIKVLVQGVGSVGKHLCKMLHEKGAILYASDTDDQKLKEVHHLFNANIIINDNIYSENIDIYSPCARGATLNTENIRKLKAKIVAGCANNQLEDEKVHAYMLKKQNILYAPDYVINAGGLINVANELIGYNKDKVESEVANIAHTLKLIFNESDKLGITTQESAENYAEKRLKSAKDNFTAAYSHKEAS